MGAKCEKRKVYSGIFQVTFFAFRTPFFTFCISQHFTPGSTFAQKLKGFRGLFLRGINKAWNSPEMRKVHSEYFVFCSVFRKKTFAKYARIAKYEKCTAGLRCSTSANKLIELEYYYIWYLNVSVSWSKNINIISHNFSYISGYKRIWKNTFFILK